MSRRLSNWPQLALEGNTVVVPTHCLYPSRAVVVAFVDSGPNSAVVSDGGGAIGEARRVGENVGKTIRTLRKYAEQWGLKVGKNGWIYSSSVPLKQIAAMVAVVSSASCDAARALVEHYKVKIEPEQNWISELERLLLSEFASNVKKEVKLVGESNKTHRFDFVVRLPDSRRLVIDAVKKDGSSINSALVHHYDLRNARKEGIVQRLVYNDREKWNASDLALLEAGAPPVALSKAQNVLKKLAA